MTLPTCTTVTEILPTTIFAVKLMHHCTINTPELHHLNHLTPLSMWYMAKNFDFYGHPDGSGKPFLTWNNCNPYPHILTIFPSLDWYLQWYSQCITQLIVMCLQGSLFLYFSDKSNRFLPQQFFSISIDIVLRTILQNSTFICIVCIQVLHLWLRLVLFAFHFVPS